MNQQELTTNLPTRNQQLKAWSNWFTNQEDWQLFAFTVVFKQRKRKKDELLEPLTLNKSVCESLYKVQVLHKIRRALERNPELQVKAVPFDEFVYYERNQGSIFKKTKSSNPHHVHAVLPIKKSQLHRFWSMDANKIQERLYKDILSIKEVQSIDVQPLIGGRETDWIKYVAKGKGL